MKLNFTVVFVELDVPGKGVLREVFVDVVVKDLSKLNAESLDSKMLSSFSSLLSLNLSGIAFGLFGRKFFAALGLECILATL